MGVSGNLKAVVKKGAAPDPGINPIVSDTNGEQVRTVDQIDGVWEIVPLIEEGCQIGAFVFGHRQHGWFTKERFAPFQSLANLTYWRSRRSGWWMR